MGIYCDCKQNYTLSCACFTDNWKLSSGVCTVNCMWREREREFVRESALERQSNVTLIETDFVVVLLSGALCRRL